jgi:hypothetical protein
MLPPVITPERAIWIINQDVTTDPKWTLTAFHDPEPQAGPTVIVEYRFRAPNFNREYAPLYLEMIEVRPKARIELSGVRTEDEFLRRVLDEQMRCVAHEFREALRRKSQEWRAPFHPHTPEGIANWGDPEGDATYNNLGF